MVEINFQQIIINSGYIVLLINFILYLKRFTKNNKSFKVICLFLTLTTVTQMVSFSLYLYSTEIKNLFISHYFFIGQLIILSVFFFTVLKNTFFKKIIFPLLILVLLVLGIQYYNEPKLYYRFNELEVLITSIPLAIYSLVFLFQKTESKNKEFIYFNAGFFIYTLCSTLIFFSGNFKAKRETLMLLWELHSFLYLAFQFLIFIEWYKNFRKSKTNKFNNTILDKTP